MGEFVTDTWASVPICNPSEDGYGLTTEIGGNFNKSPCTKTQWGQAVDKSDNATQFATKMSNVFGDHWDDLDSDDKDTVRAAFFDVKDAFA